MNFVNVQADAPEYRIPERDIVSAPRCELKRNDRVRFCRIVARVGYSVGKHSFTDEQWSRKGAEIVAIETGLSVDDVQKVVAALQNKSAYRYLYHNVYAALVKPAQAKAENSNVRGMWFRDVEEEVGVLDDYRLRKTGLYVPSVKVDYEYDEWNPPLLDQICYQRLLSVDASGGHVLVHPLDVLPLDEKSSLQGVIRF
jgi:hypothetical protein